MDQYGDGNLIGIESFRSTYTARLQDGMEVAIKVFHSQCATTLKSLRLNVK